MHNEPSRLEILERAARYRAFARQFSDEQVRYALTEFAVGLAFVGTMVNVRVTVTSGH